MYQTEKLSKDLEAKIGALIKKVNSNRALRRAGKITEIQEIEGNRQALGEAMLELQSIRDNLQVDADCVFIRQAVDEKCDSLQKIR